MKYSAMLFCFILLIGCEDRRSESSDLNFKLQTISGKLFLEISKSKNYVDEGERQIITNKDFSDLLKKASNLGVEIFISGNVFEGSAYTEDGIDIKEAKVMIQSKESTKVSHQVWPSLNLE